MSKKFGRKYKRYNVENGEKSKMIYDNEGLDDYYFMNDEKDFYNLCDILNEYDRKIKQYEGDIQTNEIYYEIKKFLNDYKDGVVHLVFPDLFDTGGVEINKYNIDNENKIRFLNDGIKIYQTLGYSMITGKHLYLPYGNCTFVFIENDSKEY